MIKRIIKKIISKLKNDTLDYNDFEKYMSKEDFNYLVNHL